MGLERLVGRLRQWRCSHAFAYEDLAVVPGASACKRARWPCSKCGKVFEGDGGLIAISDGHNCTIFHRNERPNHGVTQ